MVLAATALFLSGYTRLQKSDIPVAFSYTEATVITEVSIQDNLEMVPNILRSIEDFVPPPVQEIHLPKPEVSAVSVEAEAVTELPVPVDGIPWYVAKFPDLIPAWQACLSDPRRHDVSGFVWQGSIQGGYPNGWDYNEAMYIFGSEGGNDNCQFNTQGSGACGFGQQLPCYPEALTFEGQFQVIMSKFQDGRNQNPADPFWKHWRQWWTH